LGSLQRQAKKAEKFKEYRQELRELDRRSIMHRALLVQAERTEAEQGLALLNEQMQLAFAAVAQAESRLEEERLELLEAEKQLNTVQEELFRLRSDTAACENGLIFRRREQDTLAERLLRLDQELRSLFEGKTGAQFSFAFGISLKDFLLRGGIILNRVISLVIHIIGQREKIIHTFRPIHPKKPPLVSRDQAHLANPDLILDLLIYD